MNNIMTSYEKFQKTLAEMRRKIAIHEGATSDKSFEDILKNICNPK